MPVVAIALVLGSLLHPAFPTLRSVAAAPPAASGPAAYEMATGVFGPSETNEPASSPGERWVAPHIETPLWSEAGQQAEEISVAHLWAPLQVLGEAKDGRLPVRHPADGRQAWVLAADVGPVDPALADGATPVRPCSPPCHRRLRRLLTPTDLSPPTRPDLFSQSPHSCQLTHEGAAESQPALLATDGGAWPGATWLSCWSRFASRTGTIACDRHR